MTTQELINIAIASDPIEKWSYNHPIPRCTFEYYATDPVTNICCRVRTGAERRRRATFSQGFQSISRAKAEEILSAN